MTGTAWWMAPELVKGKQSGEASEKSDVWYVHVLVDNNAQLSIL